ncbi:MAG TPA: preprotein translocase subunit SecG [Ignavibacteriaceae bacterium]|nr:preprotein translocase subunit SecG [Ignavibacteriaceae bacterium]
MFGGLTFLAVLVSIFLIVIVLLQSSKGGGLAGTFGGAGGVGTMFGSRRTADFLSKATWWLSGALIVLAIVINLFFLPGSGSAESKESIIQKSGQNAIPTQPSLPQANPNQ